MKKIDIRLQKVALQQVDNKKVFCLVYVNNFDLAKSFFVKNNIKIQKEYKFLNMLYIECDKKTILGFEKLSFVSYVSLSSKVMTLVDVSRKILGANKVSASGKNVTIAVIDTGISSHFDFVLKHNKVKKFIDFVNNSSQIYDDNGHGTFVSGICAGSGLKSFGKYKGFAYDSDLVIIKALNANGEGNATTIIDAIQWVYYHHKEYNIKVVCMSFGSEPLGINDPIMRAAEKLWNSGICVVAAAGNSGPEYQTIKSPGTSSKIITVGGFDDHRFNDEFSEDLFSIADFSSRGPALNKIKPDIVAPSVDITGCGTKNNYVILSGTSVSAPMIAGICAQIIEVYPSLSPDQIKKLLLKSCKSICKNFNFEGAGYPFLAQK